MAGTIQAPSVTASAADGLTLVLRGGSIIGTVTGGGGRKFTADTDPANPTTILSLVPGPGGATLTNGNFRLGKTDAITREAKLVVVDTFDLNGLDQTVGKLIGDGTVQNSAAALSIFTVGATGANATFDGKLALHLALVKIGACTQIISGHHNAADGTTSRQNRQKSKRRPIVGFGSSHRRDAWENKCRLTPVAAKRAVKKERAGNATGADTSLLDGSSVAEEKTASFTAEVQGKCRGEKFSLTHFRRKSLSLREPAIGFEPMTC